MIARYRIKGRLLKAYQKARLIRKLRADVKAAQERVATLTVKCDMLSAALRKTDAI
jgi:hypothetical protein